MYDPHGILSLDINTDCLKAIPDLRWRLEYTPGMGHHLEAQLWKANIHCFLSFLHYWPQGINHSLQFNNALIQGMAILKPLSQFLFCSG
jgi:hypothetical protein